MSMKKTTIRLPEPVEEAIKVAIKKKIFKNKTDAVVVPLIFFYKIKK